MTKNKNENKCVIGIAPSSRGFGFAVMTTKSGLVDWGVKSVKSGKKNERSLAHVVKLIEIYEPRMIAVENCSKNGRKGERVRALIEEIGELAEGDGIRVKTLSGKQMNLSILRNEAGTKHQIATTMAAQYGQQLSFRLPAKRRAWQSESYQMDIFAAVALAQCCCLPFDKF